MYNGVQKVQPEIKMFMDPISVREYIMSLKIKNTEGNDRIPQRVLVDGVDQLLVAFGVFFWQDLQSNASAKSVVSLQDHANIQEQSIVTNSLKY